MSDSFDSMDSIVFIIQARIFPSPGVLPNPGLTLQVDSLPAEPQGKPKNTGVGSLSLLQRIFPTRNRTGASCIAGRFFTNSAVREAQRRLSTIRTEVEIVVLEKTLEDP